MGRFLWIFMCGDMQHYDVSVQQLSFLLPAVHPRSDSFIEKVVGPMFSTVTVCCCMCLTTR